MAKKTEKTGAPASAEKPAKQETAPKQEGRQPRLDESPQAALGQAIWIAMHAPSHRHLFLADLEWAMVPPVRLRQIRFFGDNGNVEGLATWAMVSEEVEKRLMSGNRRLAPADWHSGDRAWLIDLISPNEKTAKSVLAEIKTRLFPDRPFNMLVPGKDGKGWVGGEVKLGKPTGAEKS